MTQLVTSGCTGQISAVTFCAKTRTKAAIKNLLGEPGAKSYTQIIAVFIYKSITYNTSPC